MTLFRTDSAMLTREAIRLGRAMKGWSQRRLAEKSGLTLNRAWRLEAGVSSPRVDEAVAILNELST